MNREIKFRALYKNKLHNVDTIEYIHNKNGVDFSKGDEDVFPSNNILRVLLYSAQDDNVESVMKWVNVDNLELIQFTGLYDKNDVEIYEGDIVKIANSRGAVEYRNGAFIIVRADTATYAMTQNVNIIGNIHQNSELLENSK